MPIVTSFAQLQPIIASALAEEQSGDDNGFSTDGSASGPLSDVHFSEQLLDAVP